MRLAIKCLTSNSPVAWLARDRAGLGSIMAIKILNKLADGPSGRSDERRRSQAGRDVFLMSSPVGKFSPGDPVTARKATLI